MGFWLGPQKMNQNCGKTLNQDPTVVGAVDAKIALLLDVQI